jgi:Ca2+-binding EF-hand superfamily protein
MGNRTALKIAFTIYDKNKNGVLDSDDLLQMISLSRSFPFIEDDIAAITRAMMLRPGKVNPSNLVKRRLLSKSGRL